MHRKTRHQKRICSCSPDVGDCPRCHKIKKRYKKTRKQRGGFVTYGSKKVQGNELTAQETSVKPSVKIPEGYTLLMYDPDATHPSYIHWIATSQGDVLPYKGPSPPPGTGIHHYKFALIPGSITTNQNRSGKNVSKLVNKAVNSTEFTVKSNQNIKP